MIRQVIFYISIISFILLTFLIFELLPFIYQSSWQGIIFLVVVIITYICELFMLISNKKLIKKLTTNNIFIVAATMYVSVLYYNIYNSYNKLYDISMNYFKNNYFVLTMIFIFIILDMVVNYICEKKKIS